MTQKIKLDEIEIEVDGQIDELVIKDKKVTIKVKPQSYPYYVYPQYPYQYPYNNMPFIGGTHYNGYGSLSNQAAQGQITWSQDTFGFNHSDE